MGEHAKHVSAHPFLDRRDRIISILEAALLAVVTLVAAWSGYTAAKWGTESSLKLAEASATRTQANRAFQESVSLRTLDASTFNTWFGARIAGNQEGARVAVKRFRPQYRRAFNAWLATKPFTNLNAPPSPQAMPQYQPTGAVAAQQLDAQADEYYADGQHAAKTSDDYIRTTVILASVLFLVGISSHFPIRAARIVLISMGTALLVFAAVQMLKLPAPP